jgi:hypothetical protein
MSVQRIAEVISLLESYVLGEVNLSKRQIGVALRLLDWAIPDARPPDDGAEVLMSADDRVIWKFPRKFVS